MDLLQVKRDMENTSHVIFLTYLLQKIILLILIEYQDYFSGQDLNLRPLGYEPNFSYLLSYKRLYSVILNYKAVRELKKSQIPPRITNYNET